jgi:hypothetical protein
MSPQQPVKVDDKQTLIPTSFNFLDISMHLMYIDI